MVQPITDYPQFFTGAKQAIAEVDALKTEEANLKEEEKKLSNSLESEEKALKDSIDLTIKKRMSEVVSTYDSELSKGHDELKKAQAKREKAKTLGIKARIKEETASLCNENRELKSSVKTAFSKQKVPAFCRTRLYYALYFPHVLAEWLIVVLYILIFFMLIPFLIYHFGFPKHQTLTLVLIYAVDILVFGGIYIAIGNATKNKHMDMLKQGQSTLDQITANEKKIRAITVGIQRDKSEDKYNLASYDDEIAHINQRLADATMKKQDALNTFNTVTKNIIADELTGNAKPRLDQLKSDHDGMVKKLQDVSADRQQKTLSLSDQYEAYLGKENMNNEKIDALAEIMSHGTVSNLTEAIDELNRKEDI